MSGTTNSEMFYPAYINLQNQKCLVVGGGTVAERKVVAMLLSGGDVTVISPDATELVAFLANIGTIRWHKRQVQAGDTTGYFLVCAATDFTDINTAVFREAHEKNKIRLVNVVDVIPQCTFAAASVVTDGELMLSISTSGKSPATSRRIREYFEKRLNATSLYTLGYENEKPVPIENQGLPYPVYLLLENRTCVVLSEQETPEIERRISLLNRCGASVVTTVPSDLEDAFLVIADKSSAIDVPYESETAFIREYLDEPSAGTHFTPELVIDDALIISVSAQNGKDTDKAKRLRKRLANQFENNGYGAFIEFLGSRRAEILKAFPTPKKRADFFDTLIDTVEDTVSGLQTPPTRCCFDTVEDTVSGLQTPPTKCCLGLTNLACSAECLFNWVRCDNLERANTFTTHLLESHSEQRTKPSGNHYT